MSQFRYEYSRKKYSLFHAIVNKQGRFEGLLSETRYHDSWRILEQKFVPKQGWTDNSYDHRTVLAYKETQKRTLVFDDMKQALLDKLKGSRRFKLYGQFFDTCEIVRSHAANYAEYDDVFKNFQSASAGL